MKASLLKPEARFPMPRGEALDLERKIVMSYANITSALTRPRVYLDVAPMILALQFQPADFEYKQGQLRHVPSCHDFSSTDRDE